MFPTKPWELWRRQVTGSLGSVRFYWRCSSAYSTVALNGNKVKKIVVNLPNGPKGLLKGSFAEELKPLLPVVFLESELPSDGLKGSELKKYLSNSVRDVKS